MHGELHFGELLRALRAEAGLTQEEVAERSGLSSRAIGDLERGAVRKPQRKTVELLVDALALGEKDARALAEAARRPWQAAVARAREGAADAGPRQLPSAVHHFTGREKQLGALLRWSREAANRAADTAYVLTIDGMAGIGKTALVTELGHALAEHYPDGQLFLDLHGHTPDRAPVTPQAALARMLRAVGVHRVGDDVDELAEHWRSRVSDRRLLIILDNAAGADHVRPLIPGRGGSLVLVTSRRRLTDLDTAAGLSLDVLAPSDAYALFAEVAGPDRVVAQEADVREAVRRCGRLPLAVRIAAARLRHRPSWRVSDLLDRLEDAAADGEGRVAAAFEMSYARLDPGQQRMFRALGLHPGTDIDVYAAAALTDLRRREAADLLEGLHDQHLVEEHMPERYGFHDLMARYSRDKCAETGEAANDDSALIRLLDHYRYAASVAMNQVQPTRRDLRPAIEAPGSDVPPIDDAVSGMDWLESELPNLLACAALATERGWSAHVTQISHTIGRHLQESGRFRDADELHGLAVVAARAAGDRASLARSLRLRGASSMHLGMFQQAFADLEEARAVGGDPYDMAAVAETFGHLNMVTDRLAEAKAEFEKASALWQPLGRVDGVANCLAAVGIISFRLGRYAVAREKLLLSLGVRGEQALPAHLASTIAWLGTTAERTGDYAQACEYAERALEIARLDGRSAIEAIALSVRGRARQQLGLPEESRADLERALEIRRGGGEMPDVCISLLALGTYHHRRGEHRSAADCFREALDLTRDLDVPHTRLSALTGLGEALTGLGDPDSALVHHRRAFEVAREVGDPYLLARAQEGLGNALAAADASGRAEAETHLRQAYEAYLRLDVPDVGRIADRVAR